MVYRWLDSVLSRAARDQPPNSFFLAPVECYKLDVRILICYFLVYWSKKKGRAQRGKKRKRKENRARTPPAPHPQTTVDPKLSTSRPFSGSFPLPTRNVRIVDLCIVSFVPLGSGASERVARRNDVDRA